MSLLNCNPNCVADDLDPRYDLNNCEDELRVYGIEAVILFHCTLEFADIMDTDEWDTHIASGLIIKLPCGSLDYGDATDEIAAEDGCGRQIVDFSEVPFTFETVQVATDRSDEQWWYDLDKKWNQYTFGWVTCDGFLYLGDEATTAILDNLNNNITFSPGFSGTKTARPRWVVANGKGKAGKWTFEGYYRTNDVHRGIEIPGLEASLAAA